MKVGDLVKCIDFINENQKSIVGIVVRGGKVASQVAFGDDVLRWMSHEWLEVLNESRLEVVSKRT